MSSQTYWYLTRGSGAVALVLLSAIVVLGTLGPMRLAGTPRWPRFAVQRLHRDLSLLALVVLAVHIVTSVLDTFAPIGWLDALVPLHSSYRPVWLGLGAVAFDLLLALVITSLLRRYLGYQRWRRIHWLAYASWPIAVLHGLGTGSDATAGWLVGITVGCLLAVLLAILIRVGRAQTGTRGLRVVSVSGAVLVPVGIAAFALIGPFRSGWAARAGTPPRLLHSSAAPTKVLHAPTASGQREHRTGAFSAELQGRMQRQAVAHGALVDLLLTLHGRVSGVLRVRLAGKPLAGGGLSLIGSQVDLSSSSLGAVLDGTVVSLSGPSFEARVEQVDGAVYKLYANLDIDSRSGSVTGSLQAVPLRA